MLINSHTLFANDRGGLTYARAHKIDGMELRSDYLEDVRMLADHVNELVEYIMAEWPKRGPIPDELAMRLKFNELAIARLRSGKLKKLAEVCNAG
jgi:hypothetical protein